MIWKQPLLQEYVGVKGVLKGSVQRDNSGPEITLLLLIALEHEAVCVYGHTWHD